MTLAWQGVEAWIEENHDKESKITVDSFFSEIGEIEIEIEIELLQCSRLDNCMMI